MQNPRTRENLFGFGPSLVSYFSFECVSKVYDCLGYTQMPFTIERCVEHIKRQ